MPPLDLAEVWQRIAAIPRITAQHSLAITQACGRVLAAPTIAKTAHPHSDIAAMDGYAFAGNDAPQRLQLVGRAEAGNSYQGSPLQTGQCVRIFTGATLPIGANAVAAQEDCETQHGMISVPPSPVGNFVRHTGSDVPSGALLADAGRCLNARDLAVAIACDVSTVEVIRPIVINLLASGSELRAIDSKPTPCHRRTLNANMPAMAAGLATPANCVHDQGIVADNPHMLRQSISAAAVGTDLLILSGGVSVGEKDLIRPTLEQLGAEILFHGLRLKPGKPCLMARWRDTLVLALPGNPVSAMVGMTMIAQPLIRQLQGVSPITPSAWAARCATPLPAGGARQNLLRGHYYLDAQGQVWVCMLENQDSAALHTLAKANCFISLEIESHKRDQGDFCMIYPL